MIIDKLYKYVEERGPVCVGLDTSIDYIPQDFIKKHKDEYSALFDFNRRIIDATEDIASCYKVQIAYYEVLGICGLEVYKKTLEYLRQKGLIAICDIKRSDISSTAKMYAKAHFEGDFEGDFITLNPYMGLDSIDEYLGYVKDKEKGIFILLKTSNRGSRDIQMMRLNDGKRVYEHVGDLFYKVAKEYKGEYGYSSIGFVVGCTDIQEIVNIRERYKDSFFLIPGYGAQGGTKEDVRKLMNGKNGGVVNSSRAVLLAYKKYDDAFDASARKEVLNMREEILNGI
ncbi:orotidine-5'-phosphate decarboxylase [Thermobrachium celere]|uniref:Orotidine 5'-phosphate decarboxylase n=1 Tax=Thermobrachium celere DSM 8682 TaxID=941824 RepID=R7RUV3_9CLOT|nr:orotidine-5'-phosphate decarboxylase [Thermobrachium celere]GFR34645.1 orotidine 5'-phosphate decarboxylase [Thermobrachium celere]CDF59346.1 Orotidine 5'-phosphate decarboxylase [Thermobrachium celere DSM 8682]